MNYFFTREIKPLAFAIRLQILCLFFLLLTLALATRVFSQELEYTIKGRVVDENGKPKPKISVRLCPIQDMREDNTLTDENGGFTIIQTHKKGVTWYLYVTDWYSFSKNHWALIGLASFFQPKRDGKLFTGQPIKFGDEPIIDVGDIKVRMWYVDVNLKIQKNGKNLTGKQWQSLWVRLKDEQGRILVESSIGPSIANKVDLEKSLLKLSLPQGKWKLEFQKFDYDKAKVYPKIIGQTPYFVIDRRNKIKTIDITLLN